MENEIHEYESIQPKLDLPSNFTILDLLKSVDFESKTDPGEPSNRMNDDAPLKVQTYEKIPHKIQAIKWDGDNTNTIISFCMGKAKWELTASGEHELTIATLEDGKHQSAKHVASIGDYIIKGIDGEFYPHKPDIFVKAYKLLEK